MSGHFFPYDPRRFRLYLWMAVAAALTLTAWAVVGYATGGGLSEMARAGLAAGLLAAMGVTLYRLRPRSGWGVQVGPVTLVVARPMEGRHEVPWSEVREVRRLGKKRELLEVQLSGDRRLLVPGQLFPSRAAFEALVSAIEDKLPPSPYDA